MEKAGLAFSTKAQRFVSLGFHPDLDKTGFYKKDKSKLGPGQYDPRYETTCKYKNEQKQSMWKLKLDSEEFSSHLGFMMSSKLAEREFMSKHLGPGSHEIDNFFKLKDKFPAKNKSFGTQRRFFQFYNLPAPGPYDIKTMKKPATKTVTNLSKSSRFRKTEQPWMLAPDRYETVDTGSMKALLNKVVSIRGPYDLFTGSRGDNNTFNKFAPGKKCTPDKVYNWSSGLHYLLHSRNKRSSGKFLQAKRFPKKPTVRMMMNDISLCYRDKSAPGPAHYNIDMASIKTLPESSFPFGLTSPEELHGLKWTISPGPGRYRIKEQKCHAKKTRGSSVFLSKTTRPEYKAVEYRLF